MHTPYTTAWHTLRCMNAPHCTAVAHGAAAGSVRLTVQPQLRRYLQLTSTSNDCALRRHRHDARVCGARQREYLLLNCTNCAGGGCFDLARFMLAVYRRSS